RNHRDTAIVKQDQSQPSGVVCIETLEVGHTRCLRMSWLPGVIGSERRQESSLVPPAQEQGAEHRAAKPAVEWNISGGGKALVDDGYSSSGDNDRNNEEEE
ncbi:unnamed protein product, partial [Pylaiella littoralis]